MFRSCPFGPIFVATHASCAANGIATVNNSRAELRIKDIFLLSSFIVFTPKFERRRYPGPGFRAVVKKANLTRLISCTLVLSLKTRDGIIRHISFDISHLPIWECCFQLKLAVEHHSASSEFLRFEPITNEKCQMIYNQRWGTRLPSHTLFLGPHYGAAVLTL